MIKNNLFSPGPDGRSYDRAKAAKVSIEVIAAQTARGYVTTVLRSAHALDAQVKRADAQLAAQPNRVRTFIDVAGKPITLAEVEFAPPLQQPEVAVAPSVDMAARQQMEAAAGALAASPDTAVLLANDDPRAGLDDAARLRAAYENLSAVQTEAAGLADAA
ncbi:MAG TPA: hypothetical protein VLF69_05970 [Candidatus Saccharimonadales bacterium]|nr:hypothetical protein [Candidatus Saccharimonadales bacterium]